MMRTSVSNNTPFHHNLLVAYSKLDQEPVLQPGVSLEHLECPEYLSSRPVGQIRCVRSQRTGSRCLRGKVESRVTRESSQALGSALEPGRGGAAG